MAVVAIHTVTDAFIAREPGVRPTDHIVSGLVPLALLAGASACFWLSREGLRAVLALVLGVLALEGFALAVADARAVGVRGDDWTGFGLAPAGLALVALGLALLWRSRKRGGRRLLRRGLIAAAAVLGVYWVLVPVAIALMATHRPREAAETVELGRASAATHASDCGWTPPSRPVCDLAERRGRDRLPRHRRPRGAGACACPTRATAS